MAMGLRLCSGDIGDIAERFQRSFCSQELDMDLELRR
jgi:hypothetical protein